MRRQVSAPVIVLGLLLSVLAARAVRADEYQDAAALEQQLLKLIGAGRNREAESVARRLLALAERIYADEPRIISNCLNLLGSTLEGQARYDEAEKLHRRALAMRKKAFGEQNADVAQSLANLGNICMRQDRNQEAESLLREALVIYEKSLGPETPEVANAVNSLALVYDAMGRLTEAEELNARALAIRRKVLGPRHLEVALSLMNLGNVYVAQARYDEAETLLKQSLVIAEAAGGADHPTVAMSLGNLAKVYQERNRYALAEPLSKRSLAIRERLNGPEHPEVAESLTNLSFLYFHEDRLHDASTLCERALAIWRKALPENHPKIALGHHNLSVYYRAEGRAADAEQFGLQALHIYEKAFGSDHPRVADSLISLGLIYLDLARYDEAETNYRRALAIGEQSSVADPANLAYTLLCLGNVLRYERRFDDALSYNDRAIALLEKTDTAHKGGFEHYDLRSQLLWEMGRKRDALSALEHALERAERQRGQGSGAEVDRAQNFGQFTEAFERMATWRAELGDLDQAFEACERSRARTFHDQLALQGADPLAGVPIQEATRLRRNLVAAKRRLADLERQSRLQDGEPANGRQSFETALNDARDALFDAYRDVQMANPAFRLSVADNFKPAKLADLKARMNQRRGLCLQYSFGEKTGHCFVARADGTAEFVSLSLNDEQALAVELEPGPLTAKRLGQVLRIDDEELPRLLSNPETADRATERLALLWTMIVPETARQALTQGDVQELVVIPDGALALLPFDTLVVEPGESPKYLLDVGPPILYAPSATVLLNLAGRAAAAPGAQSAAQPVLTVANPIYGIPKRTPAAPTGALDALAARSRYGAVGGDLVPLPFTATESAWVSDVYKKQGIASAGLLAGLATEANVRFNVPGRHVLHVACHGLTDQAYGNFFGALALTPGKQASTNPADDGFLTLPEINELDLKSCELAILSACETNYGPQQQGEGVWALSRGFLVAGARRVVASNWLVDDEAAASLISYFCAGLAKGEAKGGIADHAKALHDAKRWVRQQEKWQSPYYWGTFVLVGPN